MGTRQQPLVERGNKILSYKDLLVWQKSMAVLEELYHLTRELPAGEQWCLVSQMRRAAVSIPSNIAEGYGRQATGEYHHHLSMSRGSLLELETQLLLCERLGYLKESRVRAVFGDIQQITKMLISLISKLKK